MKNVSVRSNFLINTSEGEVVVVVEVVVEVEE